MGKQKPNDQAYMRRALALAVRGRGRVSPNPLVGCVVVNRGRVVGEGYHAFFGGPHAEVNALRQAGRRARGAELYVTLEPCTHWGKTPPCAPAVAGSGVKRVVVAMPDPNPVVAGRGVRYLRRHGIHVDVGVERRAAEEVNRVYLTWRRQRRPYVILKLAASLDGKIATRSGDSRWITGAEARRLVHRLRSESDAILVGRRTAELDNPTLTSHGVGRNPLRVVLDPQSRLPLTLKLFSDKAAPTLAVVAPSTSQSRENELKKRGVQILRTSLKSSKFEPIKILRHLSKIQVSQIFIEGGGETAWTFLKSKMVDEIYFFLSPQLIGGREAPGAIGGKGVERLAEAFRLCNTSVSRVGPDILIHGRLARGV